MPPLTRRLLNISKGRKNIHRSQEIKGRKGGRRKGCERLEGGGGSLTGSQRKGKSVKIKGRKREKNGVLKTSIYVVHVKE